MRISSVLLNQKDINEIVGLVPRGTENLFDSTKEGYMFFHDTMEHYFESNHKYFKGQYSLNIAGEIAAMWHLAYYMHNHGIYDVRSPRRMPLDDKDIVATITNILENNIDCEYFEYGSSLFSCVPTQKSCSYELEQIENELIYIIKNSLNPVSDEAIKYVKSFKKSSVQNLLRWGYRQAEKLIPVSNTNTSKLYEFFDVWNKFFERSYSDFENHLREVRFKSWVDKKEWKWSAELVTDFDKKCIVKYNNIYVPYIEDLYDYEN